MSATMLWFMLDDVASVSNLSILQSSKGTSRLPDAQPENFSADNMQDPSVRTKLTPGGRGCCLAADVWSVAGRCVPLIRAGKVAQKPNVGLHMWAIGATWMTTGTDPHSRPILKLPKVSIGLRLSWPVKIAHIASWHSAFRRVRRDVVFIGGRTLTRLAIVTAEQHFFFASSEPAASFGSASRIAGDIVAVLPESGTILSQPT